MGKKQVQQKLEKQKKAEEANAKKQSELEIKRKKLEEHKLLKLKKEDISRSEREKEARQLRLAGGNMELSVGENKKMNRSNEHLTLIQEADSESLDKTEKESELTLTQSVIKRGVPKKTKPAPAVVAIKMMDLLSSPDNQDELLADDSANPTYVQQTTT